MTTHRPINTLLVFAILLLTLLAPGALAAGVPAQLPAHDNKPGDATKPVKVYILAGQSNMVGMGEISGAKNLYNAIYLTSNPDAPVGPMQVWRVGSYKVLPLELRDEKGKPVAGGIRKGKLSAPVTGVYQVITSGPNFKVSAEEKDGGFFLKAGQPYAFSMDAVPGEQPDLVLKKLDMLGNGDLEAVVKREGMFTWLVNDKGEWVERQDVTYEDARIRTDIDPTPLSPFSNNGNTIGPELGFGHVLGTYHDEQVLLIKTAMGNRALGFDFRPPSSGRTDPNNEWEAKEYDLMIEGVNKTLANIDKVVPGYKGQGYEVAGFVWWQGHKDRFTPELDAAYEKNLANLIKDVRKAFKAPEMPVAIATVGFGGNALKEGDNYWNIFNAQLAVADAKKHPALAGKVATIDTRGFWRETDESPRGEGHHYNRNAETYYRVGDALGRAMVELKGGQAQALTNPNVHEPTPPTSQELSENELAKQQAALRPILLDSVAVDYINDPRYSKALAEEASAQRPGRANQFLNGAMYGLINTYNAAGVHDYDWQSFGPDLNQAQWHIYSFDPADNKQGKGFRGVKWPDGMAEWTSPDFEPARHGWKNGQQPFGNAGGEKKGIREGCEGIICGCGITPKTLWEKEVLMVRTTIDVPKLKEGHRYRIVIGGAAHVNSGQGYAIYLDGKLVNQSGAGVGKRQGGQPRGGHLYNDVIDQLKDGKATIAVYSFLRYSGGPGPFPNGHLSVHLQQQKLPPIR